MINFEELKPLVFLVSKRIEKEGGEVNEFLKGNIYPGIDLVIYKNKKKTEPTYPDYIAWFYITKGKGIYSKISFYVKESDGEQYMVAKVGRDMAWYIVKNYIKTSIDEPDFYLYECPYEKE